MPLREAGSHNMSVASGFCLQDDLTTFRHHSSIKRDRSKQERRLPTQTVQQDCRVKDCRRFRGQLASLLLSGHKQLLNYPPFGPIAQSRQLSPSGSGKKQTKRERRRIPAHIEAITIVFAGRCSAPRDRCNRRAKTAIRSRHSRAFDGFQRSSEPGRSLADVSNHPQLADPR